MQPTRQEIYATAEDMKQLCRFGQAMRLQELGGKITPASIHPGDRFDYAATRWHVSLLGLTAVGDNMPDALDAWLRAARVHHTIDGTRRATDGRPDCPYNGAALPPSASNTAAEAT